jgi:hypothetical protein
MDGDPGEIILLLPLAFGFILFLFLLFGGLVYWFLVRFKVIEFSDKYFPLKIVKGVFLSFAGVFALFIIINLFGFVVESVIGFFK